MKARLLRLDDTMQILFCNGRIVTVDARSAFAFLSTFADSKHYAGPGKWNEEIIAMEKYRGETIAIVDDGGVLHVENAQQFGYILENGRAKLLTSKEYAALHQKDETRVRLLCREGRLAGAEQKGTIWIIPENAPYPTDERVRDGRRWGGRTK